MAKIIRTGLVSLALSLVAVSGSLVMAAASGSQAALAGTNAIDDLGLQLPAVGSTALHILSPTMLELVMITTKQPDPAVVTSWNFVNGSAPLAGPAVSEFTVTVGGEAVGVQAVGFKRRPLYAPLLSYDLRIENSLYLQLAAPIGSGQAVAVTNADGTLWPATMTFSATANPLNYSPALHVNQEGYGSALPKKAMVGYYLGSLGEMSIPTTAFSLVDATSGSTVFSGTLTPRLDVGYEYSPLPYQQVMQADFSSFTTPGQYQLVVPGLGASVPFLINDGIPMGFMRTYALGIYHQRSGTSNALPYTRFVHNPDHTAPAFVPSTQASFPFTWATIPTLNADYAATDPSDVGPELVSPATQLYPYVNQGTVDVSGGHFDAGDYSKYTINSATLVHYLMFAVDNIPGVAQLDNLGIPESGDGISDVMQEAKWEADYIAKLQDADGGFYFLVYPENRQYESNVLPDQGDPQVVYPKNTSATAAAVAALAQCASSPLFKATYPATAALYLQKAELGWQFLMNAIAKYGKDGSYQMITFYGDDWIHNDEIAWAACELFLATGNTAYQTQLFSWFPNPADPATFRWGWWQCAESWGCAIRDYAFAARNGRLPASQLNASYLAACQAQVVDAGNDELSWTQQNAYATCFPPETKAVLGGGWYFSLDQGSDMAAAYQLNPDPNYIDALVGNMNYEGGTNPLNVCYLTGLGMKRQREIVSQYAQNDRRVLPPSGIPLGNIQASFDYLSNYQGELSELAYPSDASNATPAYPYYDRWADAYNVTTEFITVNQARSLMALGVLAAQSSAAAQPWTPASVSAQISVPTGTVPLNTPLTLSVSVPGLDLTNARIVWEARDQEPAFGSTYTFSPVNNGAQWVEVEIELPDGRRVFATNSFNADGAVVNWVNGAVPSGVTPGSGSTLGSDGGDGWNWVATHPTPYSAPLDHQSNLASGEHEHWFITNTDWSPTAEEGQDEGMVIATGDTLFAYVYLDPANPPTEVMLGWYDGSGWEHRAYWGANSITWGSSGSVSRLYVGPLPAAGQWVQLSVPASAVGMAGSTAYGICYSLFGGQATWDTAGKISSSSLVLTSPTSGSTSSGGSTTTSSGTTTGSTTTSTSTSGSTSGTTSSTTGSSSTTGASTGSTSTSSLGTINGGTVWINGSLPAGATGSADGGDAWTWTTSNPTPYAASADHVSALASGLHEHYFNFASSTLSVGTGNILYTYVYLDPANPPTEIMLEWNDGSTWEHRAYWGADSIADGTDGTVSRQYMGPLPATGQWVLLQIPASQVGLEGSTLPGMGFSLYGGDAFWDESGVATSITAAPASNSGSSSGSSTPATTSSLGTPTGGSGLWINGALPAGATGSADGGDAWTWTTSNPTPYAASADHVSALATGLHEHYFNSASATLAIGANDILYTYVYLDPANPPTEIMLEWNDGSSWEHRAYWGADSITYGTDASAGRFFMGPLPATGQWVLLQVPAGEVGLGGATLAGMGFTLYGGDAFWDESGDAASITAAPSRTSSISTGTTTTATSGTGSSGTTTAPTGTSPSGTTTTATTTTTAPSGTSSSDAPSSSSPSGTTTTTTGNSSTAATSPTNPGRLINFSILSNIQGSLSMGFVIGGTGTSGSENLLIRGVGPALTGFGITSGFIADPTLTVTQQSNHATVAANSGWGANQAAVTAADTATGAFALTNPSSLDAAVVIPLPSVTGGYSATIAGKSGDDGYALTEVYDDTANYTPTSPRLINLSCLTQIAAGGTLNVGFVIGGSTAKTVLVRASGPALNTLYGIGGAIPDPQLQISPLGSSSTVLAFNAGWGGNAQVASVAASVGAYALPNPSSLDSAAVVTLPPGAYTVQVNGASGDGGTVLVEIYDASP